MLPTYQPGSPWEHQVLSPGFLGGKELSAGSEWMAIYACPLRGPVRSHQEHFAPSPPSPARAAVAIDATLGCLRCGGSARRHRPAAPTMQKSAEAGHIIREAHQPERPHFPRSCLHFPRQPQPTNDPDRRSGEQCVHLLELNLTSTAITDRGMVMLCLSPDGSARCQALRRLCVADTWVTCSGAAVALLALPALQHFDFDRMFEAMRILEAWEGTAGERVMAALGVCSARRPLSPRPALALTTVTSCGEAGSGSHGPSVTARLCPRAASLTVSGTPLPAEALYPLMVLRNLTALSLTACGAACDFEAGVLPLLTALGHQLNSLILAKFFSVDVGAIGMACPHLVNFALSDVTAFELMNQKISAESFQELQALEIWSDADFIIPTNVLQQLLLFSKNIRNILLKGVGIVTDEMFSEILKVNPMRQLSHLTLDNCHCVTHATVHRILDADNELCMLRIWSCYRINKEANDIISQRIANENMDIYLDWFPVDD
ncbi:uncharacterized protein LOC124171656 isoform X3 [Ischnura elegans]|uniref:uncharacterized protein LOC124171656 isoform X3 n=1 Tax=Ischnura elegans TaxID=197161 RepID=UPI001ED86882|nr:uncharacterized protein LOC124171656 isoform X3 [Ischnura elegans]